MPQLSTGLVIAGAYADKVRRVAFAQLRDELKKGTITADVVVRRTAELNRLLYDILVNKLKVDKGDVVRIRIEYEISDSDLKWKLDTLQIEVFKRIPQEEVEKAIKEAVKAAEEVLAAPPTAEERAWIEEERREERPEKREEVEKPEKVELWKPDENIVHEVAVIGQLEGGGILALVRNVEESSVGIVSVRPADGKSKVLAVLIPSEREAYKAETEIDKPVEEVSEDDIKKTILELTFQRIDPEEAQKIIREEREKLV